MKKRDALRLLSLFLKYIWCFGLLLFVIRGLLLGMIRGGTHCERRAQPYFVPTRIEDAVGAEGRIYLLYADSGAVNVYDDQGGFLWALSVPWHDHNSDVRLRVSEGRLYLYQRGYQAYRFDSGTGEYQDTFLWEGHEEQLPNERAPRVEPESRSPGDRVYNDLTVYQVGEDGMLEPLIPRSGWIRLLYFSTAWAFSFFGILAKACIDAVENEKRKLQKQAGQNT